MTKFLYLTGAAVAMTLSARAQSTIADWTFETSAPTTAGPFSPETGSGSATGSHAGAAVYTSPSGNGSTHSFSSTVWAVGDYYQFQVSTLGDTGDYLTLSFDQTSSNTGPGQYQLEYSIDGVTFNNVGSVYTVLANASPNSTWNPTTGYSAYTFTPNLSSLTVLANQAAVYIRMADAGTTSANGGTVASGGTDRIDNVIIGVTPVPEPSTLALVVSGTAACGLLVLRRRH